MAYLSSYKRTGLINLGAYSATTRYYIDNIVTYNDITYVCIVNNTYNVVPTNTSNWAVLAKPPTLSVSTVGTGTNPASYTLSVSGNTITLNKI